MIATIAQSQESTMTEREFAERIAMPAVLGFFQALPGAIVAWDVALVMQGDMFGWTGIVFPVVLAWLWWDGRHSWDQPADFLKMVGVSWLVGLPVGVAAWGLAHVASTVMA